MTRRDFYLMRLCELLDVKEPRRMIPVTVVTRTRDIRCRCNRIDCSHCNAITVRSQSH